MKYKNWMSLFLVFAIILSVSLTVSGKGASGTDISLCGNVVNLKQVDDIINGNFTGTVTITTCVEERCNSLAVDARSVPVNFYVAKRWFSRDEDYFFAMSKRHDDECKFNGGAIKKTSQDLFDILIANELVREKISFELAKPQIEIDGKITRINAGVVRGTDSRIK